MVRKARNYRFEYAEVYIGVFKQDLLQMSISIETIERTTLIDSVSCGTRCPERRADGKSD